MVKRRTVIGLIGSGVALLSGGSGSSPAGSTAETTAETEAGTETATAATTETAASGPTEVAVGPEKRLRFEPDEGEIVGVAWAGDDLVETVEVSTDGGDAWSEPECYGPAYAKTAWRQFRYVWNPDPGEYTVVSRVTDAQGFHPARDGLGPRSCPSTETGASGTR